MSAAVDERPVDFLPVAARGLWPNLPALLLGSVLVCAGSAVALVGGGGVAPLSPLLLAGAAGPAWAGLIATTNRVVLGGETSIHALLADVRRQGGAGWRVSVVPAVATGLTLLALALFTQTRQPWLLAPLAVGCVSSVLLVLAAVLAVPLRVADPARRGRELWYAALSLVAANPLIPVGVVVLVTIGLLTGATVAASLLPLVAGPIALVVSAGTWTAAAAVGLPLPAHDPTD